MTHPLVEKNNKMTGLRSSFMPFSFSNPATYNPPKMALSNLLSNMSDNSTEDTPLDFPPLTKSHILHCSYHSWYPKYAPSLLVSLYAGKFPVSQG
jgi:hypothetical protein